MVKRYQNLIICPEANLRLYVSLCDLMTIDVRDGYLFRCMVTRDQASVFFLPAAKKKGRRLGPWTRGVQCRLRLLSDRLSQAVWHLRRGGYSQLFLMEVPMEDVALHVGLKSLRITHLRSVLRYFPTFAKLRARPRVPEYFCPPSSSSATFHSAFLTVLGPPAEAKFCLPYLNSAKAVSVLAVRIV